MCSTNAHATIFFNYCFHQELQDFMSDDDTGWKLLPGGGRGATSASTATTSTLPYPYKANVVDANGLPPVRSNVNSGKGFKPYFAALFIQACSDSMLWLFIMMILVLKCLFFNLDQPLRRKPPSDPTYKRRRKRPNFPSTTTTSVNILGGSPLGTTARWHYKLTSLTFDHVVTLFFMVTQGTNCT